MRKHKSQLLRKIEAIDLESFELGNVEGISSNLTLDEQADLLPYDKKYEFCREKLQLGEKLGGGAFGIVYKGIAHGIFANEEKTTVAVKMVKRMSNDEVYKCSNITPAQSLSELSHSFTQFSIFRCESQ